MTSRDRATLVHAGWSLLWVSVALIFNGWAILALVVTYGSRLALDRLPERWRL